jgi:hypothetical protein
MFDAQTIFAGIVSSIGLAAGFELGIAALIRGTSEAAGGRYDD